MLSALPTCVFHMIIPGFEEDSWAIYSTSDDANGRNPKAQHTMEFTDFRQHESRTSYPEPYGNNAVHETSFSSGPRAGMGRFLVHSSVLQLALKA